MFLKPDTHFYKSGWAYKTLTDTSTALSLTKQVVNTYVDTLHGNDSHQTPKTLAVVDTSLVDPFVLKWEILCAELNRLQKVDATLNAHIHRARAETVAYYGSGDQSGKTPDEKSSVDIGSFLKTFQTHCSPTPGSALAIAIQEAMAAYNKMFIIQRTGQGTPTGTGMAILWPLRAKYNQEFFEYLFADVRYATASAPNFQLFLKELLTGTAPTMSGNACQISLQSEKVPENPGQLLLEPSLAIAGARRRLASAVTIATDVAITSDYVQIGYGMNFDVSSSRMRKLRQVAQRNSKHSSQGFRTQSHGNNRGIGGRRLANPTRRTQEEDFLILFGGDVLGSYSGPTYSATWDRRFYLINDIATGALEDVYAFDDGEGAKTIPVMYFPSGTTAATLTNIPDTVEATKIQLGGQSGFLSFSVNDDGVPLNNLILFTASGLDNQTYSETPTSAGGFIAPIVYVEAIFDGKFFDVLVGGFNSTVLPWNEESTLRMSTITDQEYADIFDVTDDPVGPVLIDVVAYDFDIYDEDSVSAAGVESKTLNVPLPITVAPTTKAPTTMQPTTMAPTMAPTMEMECFSGTSLVSIKHKGEVRMDQLSLGDKIMTVGGGYETIYSFGHRDEFSASQFLQFLPSGLEISSNHMVFMKSGKAVPASAVKRGDMLMNGQSVTDIRIVQRKGMYAPFTASGTLLVNGIAVSSFVAFQNSDVFMIGSFSTGVSYHWLAHNFEAPHRMFCKIRGGCMEESYTEAGISKWVDGPLKIANWMLAQNTWTVATLTIPLIIGVAVVAVMNIMFDFPLAILVVAASVLIVKPVKVRIKSTC